jgi:REP element-mobilizing transposase RayT
MEGGLYHAFARGNDRQAIFRDDFDRNRYLSLLGRVVKQKSWRCLGYCLMDNHVHLLAETPNADLSSGMQWLHGIYGRVFNGRHGRVGHLFQGRFGAVRMTSNSQTVTASTYIAMNPVEAGLCRQPSQYRWSSYGAVMSNSAPDWLDTELSQGSDPGGGRA